MIKIICTVCKVEEVINYIGSIPTNWASVQIIGRIPSASGYMGQQNVRKELCISCASKVFSKSTVELTHAKRFEEFAIDYLQDLAAEAIDEVMESR